MCAGVLLCGSAGLAAAQGGDWKLFVEGEGFAYTESAPIIDLLDGLETERFRAGGDEAFTHNVLRAGVGWKGWRLAGVARYDYTIAYSPDTANALVARVAIPDGPKDVVLKANHTQGYGAELWREIGIGERFRVDVGLQVFRATTITDGRLSGSVVTEGGDIASGTLELDYVYTDDLLLRRVLPDRSGTGVSLNLRADWQPTDALALAYRLDDAIGRVWWGEVDRTVADADTQLLRRDGEGIIDVRPTLRGVNSVESHEQTLRPRHWLEARYGLSDRWAVSQDVRVNGSRWFATTGADFIQGERVRFGPRVEWTTGAFGAEVKAGPLFVKAMSDSWRPATARYADVRVGLRAGW